MPISACPWFCTYLQKLSPGMKPLLSQVIPLAKSVLVAAAINATSDQSFRAMLQAKSYLQSMMGQQRLNYIMVLHVHKKRTDKLDLITVANEFVDGFKTHPARFGRFDDTDWHKNFPVKTQSVLVSSIKFWLLCWIYWFCIYTFFCVIFLSVYFKNWHFRCT